MNNLRKIKKKKRSKVLNPQQLAKQKLFQISHFQDQEELNDPDTFLGNLLPKHTYQKLAPTHKRQKTESYTVHLNCQQKKPRIFNTFSLNELKQKSNDFLFKQPLSITNYLVIDERDKKCIHEDRERSLKNSIANILKRKAAGHGSNSRSMYISHSYDLKRQAQKQRIKNIRNQVSSVIQIKNIKLFSKYPSFFSH